MAKKSSNKSKVIGGAVLGAMLGLAAGIILTPSSGKKTRKDMKRTAANFYKYIAPRIRKVKNIGEKEFKKIVEESLKTYAKAKKLSLVETKEIGRNIASYWQQVRKIP